MSIRPSSSHATSADDPPSTHMTGNEDDLPNTQMLQRYMVDIYAITGGVDDIGMVYRNLRPIWANNAVSHLVDPCIKILSKIPTADTANIERAVRKLTNEFRRLLNKTQSKGFAFDILVWACNLFVEICKYNYERPIAKNAGITPPALLALFDSCPAVSCVIKLTDKAIASLLNTAPDECLSILIDASAHGFCFAWIWLHIAISFPDTIVAHLLKIGIQDFKHYLNAVLTNQAPMELHESYKQKFLSICDVFTFLATQNNAELKNAMREMICGDREVLENATATPEQLQNLSLPFLIKMVANSPDILRFLVHNVYDLGSLSFVIKSVTEGFIINGAKYVSQLNKQCLLPLLPNTEYTYTAFMRQITFYLNSDALARIVELMLPIAFNDNIFEKFGNYDQRFQTSMKDSALQILTEIIGMVVSLVHNQAMYNVGESALLKRCASHFEILEETIQNSMAGGERSKLFIPYVHAFCIASGPVRTAEVIARYIIKAKNEEQLICLISLLASLIIFAPNTCEDAITNFFANRTTLMLEKKGGSSRKFVQTSNLPGAPSFDDDFYDIKWIHNLRTLNEWEKMSDDEHVVKYMRFEMSKHYGELATEVLRWTLDALSSLKRQEKMKTDESIKTMRDSITEAALSLCSSIGPAPVLEPRYPYKLSAQFASLIVLLLDYVGQEDDSTGFPLFTNACTCTNEFLTSQVGYVREQFIIHLFDEASAKASDLFGCSSLSAWETELQFSGSFQRADRNDILDVEEEESLFDLVRKLPLYQQKAVHLAHSGVIGRGAKRLEIKNVKNGSTMRRLVFFECLQQFCSAVGSDGNLIPYQQVYKQLAIRLTDRVCRDGLAASFVWEEWDQAREVIPRYLAVSKRFSEIPIIWDAMLALAEVHPCLWYCCPLLKAYLAVIMIQFENCSDQKSIPRKQLTNMLDKWLLLARKGQMLPEQMVYYFELITRVSYREGFVILLDIWQYFQSVLDAEVSAANMINAAFDRSLNSPIDPIVGNPTKFRESCRLVIQRNIAKVGFIFPLIFSDERNPGSAVPTRMEIQ
uniref:Xpo1 domain-containing protein n=1 Tax=Elaeophora elaphi TaxID=1147741 RepID=A0A158Q7K8_9BILA